jgi:hypothetical protein
MYAAARHRLSQGRCNVEVATVIPNLHLCSQRVFVPKKKTVELAFVKRKLSSNVGQNGPLPANVTCHVADPPDACRFSGRTAGRHRELGGFSIVFLGVFQCVFLRFLRLVPVCFQRVFSVFSIFFLFLSPFFPPSSGLTCYVYLRQYMYGSRGRQLPPSCQAPGPLRQHVRFPTQDTDARGEEPPPAGYAGKRVSQ